MNSTRAVHSSVSSTEGSHELLSLYSMIIKGAQGVEWDDVVGLEDAKEALRDSVELPLELPHLFTGEGAWEAWNGILLYGLPGTGKTLLVKALASSNENITFISVTAADLLSKMVGDSPKLVRELFTEARKNKPAVVLIIGATNRPYDIDPAVLSRFQKKLFFRLPNLS